MVLSRPICDWKLISARGIANAVGSTFCFKKNMKLKWNQSFYTDYRTLFPCTRLSCYGCFMYG
jgi:hypothetical protein